MWKEIVTLHHHFVIIHCARRNGEAVDEVDPADVVRHLVAELSLDTHSSAAPFSTGSALPFRP